ncbi:hypothetical protein GCM10007183_15880 [Staphylococcus muscae]|uniref:Uncharacterized protein n=1 Tax=Staphylococcus muscae TaxID=1294 RepID=A0ABQ1HVR2_9STAP|nr:hypothetical protein GCM10007183_15880 [Staphylococcus muscae]
MSVYRVILKSLSLNSFGEILNLGRTQIRWALDHKNYKKVPKSMFVNETNRGSTYFWLPEQFTL